MDVSDPVSVAEAVRHLSPEIHGLDALVSCAGLSLHTAFEELSPDEWNRVITVNLNGAFHVLQALTPLLRDGASVVTVSSVSAQTGVSHQAHYAAAKAGLVNLTKNAARRAPVPRIRVNCVTPGVTMTLMGQDAINALEQDYAKNKILFRRYATPEEIALCRLVSQPDRQLHHRHGGDVNRGRELGQSGFPGWV